jgi:pyruvate formate lyase activating enzyme
MENIGIGTSVPGRYWHALADGRLQCDLCPR